MDEDYLESIGLGDAPSHVSYLASAYESPEMMREAGQILTLEAYLMARIGITATVMSSAYNARSVREGNGVRPNLLIAHSGGLALNRLASSVFRVGVIISGVGTIIEQSRDNSTT